MNNKRHLLVGNGINIQFGGNAYSSKFILKRIKYNCRIEKYSELFAGKVTGEDLETVFDGLVDIANEIIDKKFTNIVNDNLLEATEDFQSRYREKVKCLDDIMLEDWLLLVEYFFIKNSDLNNIKYGLLQGIKQILLDGIYNEGKIQKVYCSMNEKVKEFLKGYYSIYSLNYDNNIDNLLGKGIYHLHGDFSVLANSENKNNVLGYMNTKDNKIVWQPERKHCYCNALLEYSGELKYGLASKCHKSIVFVDDLLQRNEEYITSYLLKLSQTNPQIYEELKVKLDYPELKWNTEYYFYKFENIEGELDILGISPNNDSHIFRLIEKNTNITKVTFYCYSEKEEKYIKEHFDNEIYECKRVQVLWKSLGCVKNKNNNYKIPNKYNYIVKCYNELFDDNVSFEQVKSEINQMSKGRIYELYNMVEENCGANNILLSEKDFNNDRYNMCSMAVSEGVNPTTLGVIYTLIYNKNK